MPLPVFLCLLWFAFGYTGIALVIGAMVYVVYVVPNQILIALGHPIIALVVSIVGFILFLKLWVVFDHSVIAGVIVGAYFIVWPYFTPYLPMTIPDDVVVDPPESGPGGCF